MSSLLCAACLVGGLFALIALMPDFEGTAGAGWEGADDEDEA